MTITGTSVMEMVAADTGGRAFYNTNDISGAIRRAVDDSDVTYTLGFYPDSKSLDSTFHPLKVEVAKKGLEVRYRKGYTASPDSLLTDGDREQMVKDALWSPLAATGITIAATLSKIDQPKSLKLVLIIDPSELEFTSSDGKRKAEVEVAFEQRSADGHDLGRTEQLAPITLDEDRYQSKQPLDANENAHTCRRIIGSARRRVRPRIREDRIPDHSRAVIMMRWILLVPVAALLAQDASVIRVPPRAWWRST